MSPTLRNATKKDAEKIAELETDCFDNPWPLEAIENEFDDNPFAEIFVLVADDKIVAYLDFMITFDSATISRLAVLPAYRQRGYASLLLDQMEAVAKAQKEPVSFLTLEVRPSNRPAIALYEKNGYIRVTTKKAYYDNGEDAAYYVRSL